MRTMDVQASKHPLGPFLDQAAAAGVVAGCGEGFAPEFEARRLALVALTTLHEGREAVEARLESARQELAALEKAQAEVTASAAVGDPPAAIPTPEPRRGLLARIAGWFKRRSRRSRRAEPVKPESQALAPVSRADLAGKVRELEARCRELLGLEADYNSAIQAQYDTYRCRAAALRPARVEGGQSCRI